MRTEQEPRSAAKWRRALCPGAWERWRTWHPDMIARLYKGGWWRLTMPGEGKGGCLHISEHRTLREAKARARSGASSHTVRISDREPEASK